MADQWYGGQSGRGERWNVNLPAVVGVVFVFLLGVVIWVIATSGGDDAVETGGSTASTVPTTAPVTTAAPSTSPQPMPATVPATVAPTAPPAVPVTVPPTAAPATAPPAPPPPTAAITTVATTTVAPTTAAPPVAGNGDLGVPGHPIQKPACDGSFITVIASAVGDEATAPSLDAVLDRYTGSNYLRTDQTCPSLTPAIDGEPIYVVYLGPFASDADACRARSQGPAGSYVRRLATDLTPGHSVTCA